MTQCYIPQGYKSALDVRETETAIKFVKDTFERTFSKAMQLLRWRKNSDAYGNVYGGYPNGDLGRIETQQAFLKAVIEKCLNSISLGTIPKMAQIFLDNVDTNGSLTVNNLAWFAKEAIVGGLSMENVNFMTLKMAVEFDEGQDPKAVMAEVLKNCKKVESDCEIFL